MTSERCVIHDCNTRPYAPAGTGAICKPHFIDFLTWRRRRGLQMFLKYAGMTMPERDTVVEEWRKTVKVDDAPVAPAAKP
jgi:hypothetical protein